MDPRWRSKIFRYNSGTHFYVIYFFFYVRGYGKKFKIYFRFQVIYTKYVNLKYFLKNRLGRFLAWIHLDNVLTNLMIF